jgi:hypothetical protein
MRKFRSVVKRECASRSRDFAVVTPWRLAKLIIAMTKMPVGCSSGSRDDRCKELQAISPELGMLHGWRKILESSAFTISSNRGFLTIT